MSIRSLMPCSESRSSWRSVSGVAARRSAHSSRSNERYRSATAKTYAHRVAPTQAATNRKLLGAWYTPPELVDVVVDNILATFRPARGRPVRVLDPACGDGRFLFAVAERLAERGLAAELTGCDVDGVVLGSIDGPVRTIEDDALAHDWGDETFDIVVGNPPFLSQMAASTSRGGASRHGGGPYADAAVEFLALAVR